MRDKRPVDELTIEELECIIALRKRETRQAQLRTYERTGRRITAYLFPKPANAATNSSSNHEEASDMVVPQRIGIVDHAPKFEDDLAKADPESKTANRLQDRILLGIEIAATLGVFFLLVSLLQTLRQVSQVSGTINQQAQRTALAQLVTPTATPILNIQAVVIPSGHKVKVDASGRVIDQAFNFDEVPAQYQADYRQLVSEPYTPPTPVSEGPVAIEIPRINVRSTVVTGDNWQALQLGVGQHDGTANPGQRGNMVLSAHNDVYGETFRYLDRLRPGDPIYVSTMTKKYTYVVQNTKIVRASDTWILDSQGDGKQLTLISCYPYQVDNQRIAVFAVLQE